MMLFSRRPGVRRQRGLTAIETLLALAAGSLAVLGAITIYQAALQADKVSKATEQLLAVQNGVRQLYATKGGFTDDDGFSSFGTDVTELLITSNSVPSNMIVSSTELRHPWNGRVRVQTNKDNFEVTYEDVPRDACIRLLSGEQGQPSSGLAELKIGNRNLNLPVSVSELASQSSGCQENTSANDLTWVYQ